jgi:hypothetical protein
MSNNKMTTGLFGCSPFHDVSLSFARDRDKVSLPNRQKAIKGEREVLVFIRTLLHQPKTNKQTNKQQQKTTISTSHSP